MARRDGEARRQQLVGAALRAVHARGIVDLRIRDVAEEAGVATGTVHYHFKDLDELLVAIHEEAVDRFVSARRDLVTSLDDARQKLTALADTGVPDSDADVLVAALYDMNSLVRRNPTHRALMRSLAEQQCAIYAAAFEIGRAQGHFTFDAPVLDLATNAVALEDAYGLYIVTRNASFPAARARRLMRLHLAEITHCPDLLEDDMDGGLR